MSSPQKKCSKCDCVKELACFASKKTNKDGLQHWCRPCVSEFNRAYREKNRLKLDAYRIEWSHKNKDRQQSYRDKWTKENPNWKNPNKAEDDKKYYYKNRDAIIKASLARAKKNPAKLAFYCRTYQASKRKRTPKWADRRKMEAFYQKAYQRTKETGIKHHVDHILPLRGEFVSGLHCEFNLQVLPASENIRKKNDFDPALQG